MSDRFCPELQLPWSLVSLEMRDLREVLIRVVASTQLGFPNPVGRTTRDVMSWPAVWSEMASANFTFSQVLMVAVSDEFAGLSEDGDLYEGERFRRYSKSLLLRQCEAARPGAENTLLHYRLVFQNEFVDVVCTTPPEVELRAAAHEPVA
jgi:hypothetical protein